MSVRAFLTGTHPVRALGASFVPQLNRPKRPGLRTALSIAHEERPAFERDIAFGRQAVAERLASEGLIPESWLSPSPRRLFDTDSGAATNFTTVPLRAMISLASLGAGALQQTERLLLEAHARSLVPGERLSEPRLHWGWVADTQGMADNPMLVWEEGLTVVQDYVGEPRSLSECQSALLQTVSLEANWLRLAEKNDLLTLSAKARLKADEAVSALRNAYGLAKFLRVGFLTERRLWALVYLHEMSRHPTRVKSRLGDGKGPTRQELLDFLRPVASLYALGVMPGAIGPSTAEVRVPVARKVIDADLFDDEETEQDI